MAQPVATGWRSSTRECLGSKEMGHLASLQETGSWGFLPGLGAKSPHVFRHLGKPVTKLRPADVLIDLVMFLRAAPLGP